MQATENQTVKLETLETPESPINCLTLIDLKTVPANSMTWLRDGEGNWDLSHPLPRLDERNAEPAIALHYDNMIVIATGEGLTEILVNQTVMEKQLLAAARCSALVEADSTIHYVNIR